MNKLWFRLLVCLTLAVLPFPLRAAANPDNSPAPASATNTASTTAASSLATNAPLPALDTIIQRAMARAAREDDNDRQFNHLYQYEHTRLTEFRNGKGELKAREEKVTYDGVKTNTAPAQPAPPPKPAEPDGPLSESHSKIHGQVLRVKDYSLADLVSRFDFTLVGREMVNGRPALVVDFQPAKKSLPVHSYKDNFINKAAGRLWVDEEDYAIAKADLYLSQRVNVLGGLAGAVWKFTYSFTRDRTPEALWYARHVDWHLEGREVIFNRIVDFHEERIAAKKVAALKSPQ